MFAIAVLALLAIEFICADELWQRLRERSEERTQQRRAAVRPRIHQDVHDSWTVLRNRRDLWESVEGGIYRADK